jgi:Ser/Thr protein kinase RdoA (MazF antagonist)
VTAYINESIDVMNKIFTNCEAVSHAAAQFGKGRAIIEPLGNGLINDTYKVNYEFSPAVVLQCINANSFPKPEQLIQNYRSMEEHLAETETGVRIPGLIHAKDGKSFWKQNPDPGGKCRYWRATAFRCNCYSPEKASTPQLAGESAHTYALFSKALTGIPLNKWEIVIPDFHNLGLRYQQFEESIKQAAVFRLLKATHIIASLREKKHYVDFYMEMQLHPDKYPDRLQHHDCKINNLLFDKNTGKAVAVVDLDTVMPGKYFSDLGDMIRTMACTEDENSRNWEKIDVDIEAYTSILQQYKEVMKDILTSSEMANLQKAGLIMTYMQTLRFATDFLNNDIYYKVTEPEHNLYRAFNQLILLEKLEEKV